MSEFHARCAVLCVGVGVCVCVSYSVVSDSLQPREVL